MKFCLGGKSLEQYDAKHELKTLIPELLSVGHELVEPAEADVELCYGIPQKTKIPAVLRWDSTCTQRTLDDEKIKAVIFRSQREESSFDIKKNSYVCPGCIDVEDVAKNTPPGLSSIRSEFDTMFIAASPVWVDSDCEDEDIKIYESLKSSGKFGKSGLFVVGPSRRRSSRSDTFYVSWLDRKERAELFSISSFMICASRRLPVPPEVMESLSQGTPVIHAGQLDATVTDGLGYAWDNPADIRKYPWKLDAISSSHAANIFSDAFSCVE